MAADCKPYPHEFKVELVNMITGGGASAAQVAKDMDIDLKLLYQWIKELSSKPEPSYPGKGRITSDAEVIRKLKRENERLKQECEMLKKAREFLKDPE